MTVNGNFNSFVRLPSGTILISGVVDFSSVPGLFRSHDQGTSFEMIPNPPGIRALSQRNGLLYAAADNFGDGYAIGTSTDEGSTWKALMTFSDVKAINPCLKSYCQSICEMEVGLSLWTEDVCTADAPVGSGTAGSGGGGAGSGGTAGSAGSTGAAGAGTGGTGGKPPSSGHNGCAMAGAAAAGSSTGTGLPAISFFIVGVGLILAARRRR
jgi:hypothetical protein